MPILYGSHKSYTSKHIYTYRSEESYLKREYGSKIIAREVKRGSRSSCYRCCSVVGILMLVLGH